MIKNKKFENRLLTTNYRCSFKINDFINNFSNTKTNRVI